MIPLRRLRRLLPRRTGLPRRPPAERTYVGVASYTSTPLPPNPSWRRLRAMARRGEIEVTISTESPGPEPRTHG